MAVASTVIFGVYLPRYYRMTDQVAEVSYVSTIHVPPAREKFCVLSSSRQSTYLPVCTVPSTGVITDLQYVVRHYTSWLYTETSLAVVASAVVQCRAVQVLKKY